MNDYKHLTDQQLRERYVDRDQLLLGLLIELRKTDKRVWFLDEFLKLRGGVR